MDWNVQCPQHRLIYRMHIIIIFVYRIFKKYILCPHPPTIINKQKLYWRRKTRRYPIPYHFEQTHTHSTHIIMILVFSYRIMYIMLWIENLTALRRFIYSLLQQPRHGWNNHTRPRSLANTHTAYNTLWTRTKKLLWKCIFYPFFVVAKRKAPYKHKHSTEENEWGEKLALFNIKHCFFLAYSFASLVLTSFFSARFFLLLILVFLDFFNVVGRESFCWECNEFSRKWFNKEQRYKRTSRKTVQHFRKEIRVNLILNCAWGGRILWMSNRPPIPISVLNGRTFVWLCGAVQLCKLDNEATYNTYESFYCERSVAWITDCNFIDECLQTFWELIQRWICLWFISTICCIVWLTSRIAVWCYYSYIIQYVC